MARDNVNIDCSTAQISNKIIDSLKTKLLKLQNTPSSQYNSQYLDNIRYALYKYSRFKIIAQTSNTFTSKLLTLEKPVQKLISRLARLEAAIFIKSNLDIYEILDNDLYAQIFFEKGMTQTLKFLNETKLKESTRERLKQLIPKNPKDEYPKARSIKRHFIIHVGLTNTGKTYHSLERLKSVESGVYLGPLRLLALEVQDTLNTSGVPCNLITGEQENLIDGAKHTASTVEKLDINKRYDVAVIDECQLIGDASRGFAWSRAILGVYAPEVHLATAPEGLSIIIKIIEMCGDTYEVIEHERQTQLIFDSARYQIPHDIQKGDALIVFSRRHVLMVAEYLARIGIKASVIYGALPYSSRKQQLELFLNGTSQVVVSTDAIGMGLNLPIKRIIFLEQQKFDGIQTRNLETSEIKQIAGRAGRIGMYPEGHVLTMGNREIILSGMKKSVQPIDKAYIGFDSIVASVDCDLIDTLRVWKSIATFEPYKKMDISRFINLDFILKWIFKDVGITPTRLDEYKMLVIPFDEKNEDLLDDWGSYVRKMLLKENIKMPVRTCKYLDEWETYYRQLDLYYSFARNFGYDIDDKKLEKMRLMVTYKINELLLQKTSGKPQKVQSYKKKLARK